MALEFLRRGKIVRMENFAPDTMLLDYLRLTEKSRGTKEGCNEGDCGACTVVLGEAGDGRMIYKAVNACILFLGQIHGKELITVEDLAEGQKLHPVQQSMVNLHASQCGFCTPGFVMSLFALGHAQKNVTRDDVITAIAGNLCRCTGYRPIIDAGLKACKNLQDRFVGNAENSMMLLRQTSAADLLVGDAQIFFAAPASANALANLVARHPEARVVSGATDVGLWVTKQFKSQKQIIFTGRAKGFADVVKVGNALHIGGGATYAEAQDALTKLAPDIGAVMHRLGSVQVRNSGTIGGNIANGSPIGDMPPMLIALGAILVLRSGETERQMPVEDFFIDYGKQDRSSGELVWRIKVPATKPNQIFKAYKITKRFDQDISAAMGAFLFTLEGEYIAEARIAFGGMAATPKRATKTEAALRGKTLAEALRTTLDDYTPITDMRASAEYRREIAAALLKKALLEIQGAKNLRVLA